MIAPALAQKTLQRQYIIGYYTFDQGGQQPVAGNYFTLGSQPLVFGLSKAGILAPPTIERQRNMGGYSDWKEVFPWVAAPTGAGSRLLSVSRSYVDELPTARTTVAVSELVEVTGLTAPTQGLPPGPMITAEFTYRWSLTAAGTAVDALERSLPETHWQSLRPAKIYRGRAQFVKYDDGWRLENLSMDKEG